MAISSKVCNPDNFELDNSLKTLTNLRGLPSHFVECESFLEWNSPDIFALCDTNLDDLIDSGNFSVRDYLPLTQKDHGRQQGFGHHHWLSFTQCLISFSSTNHLLHLYAQFLMLFNLTSMRFSRSTHLLKCLSLGILASIIRTGWLILLELIDLVNSCFNFSIWNDFTYMVNFPTGIPDCYSQSCSFGFIPFFWH